MPRGKPKALAALEKATQAAGAIQSLEHMWAQSPGETDEQYEAFHHWLALGTRRGQPPEEHKMASRQFQWSKRAIAYAKAWDMSKQDKETPPEAQIVSNLRRTIQMEAQKLIDEASSNPSSTISMKDLMTCVDLLDRLQQQSQQAASKEADVRYGTTEEIDIVMQAQAIIQLWAERKQKAEQK